MSDRTDIDAIKRAILDPLAFLGWAGIDAKREAYRARFACPCCNASRGATMNERGGVLVWRCHTCESAGDVFSLLAAVRGLDAKRDFTAIKLELAAYARVELQRPAAERRIWLAPLPVLPPRAEVAALWSLCRPTARDPEVAAWLGALSLDPDRIDALGLCAALPAGAALPRWARHRGEHRADAATWDALGYRAIFRLWDAAGDLRSVRARPVRPRELPSDPKSVTPPGYTTAGLVVACPNARALLDCGEHATAFDSGGVTISEGEKDFLARASRGVGPAINATFGIGSGSWSPALAARIPNGSTVWIRTHRDDAGDRYAADIGATLADRCTVLEWHPDERLDRRRTLRATMTGRAA